MALRLKQSDWIISDKTLKKQIGYFGLAGEGTEHILQIHIDTSPNIVLGGVNTHVCILLYPNYINCDAGYVPAQLALDDSPLDAEIVTARCGPCDDGALIIQPVDLAGAKAFLATLSKCQMMRLTLFDDNGAFLRLPIPNDEQYRHAARSYFARVKGVATHASMLGMLGQRKSVLSR